MRQVSLREFRTRGTKALGASPQREPVLLAGREGPAYFLVPVLGDVGIEDRELRRAMAKASLREGWLRATDLTMDDAELDREIEAARSARSTRKTQKRR